MPRIGELVAPRRMGTDFRWLLASSWTSNVGDGIALAAAPLLIASMTSSPILVASGAILEFLPWLNVTWAAPWGVLVLYATEHLHMGAIGYGMLTTASAAGGLLGTVSFGRLERQVSTRSSGARSRRPCGSGSSPTNRRAGCPR